MHARHSTRQKKIMILVCLLILGLVIVGFVWSHFMWAARVTFTTICSKVNIRHAASWQHRILECSMGLFQNDGWRPRADYFLVTNVCCVCLPCRRRLWLWCACWCSVWSRPATCIANSPKRLKGAGLTSYNIWATIDASIVRTF